MFASLDPILLDLALLFALCVGVVIVFHRLRLPPVVGFLLTGVAIGPNALGLVAHQALVEQLAEVGVVILLFSVGMELPLRQLVDLRRTVLLAGGLQIGLSLALGAGAALLGGLSLPAAVFVGLLLAMSSTAVATKLLSDRGELGSPIARLSVPILVAQDLAVVPVILLLPLLAGGDSSLSQLAMQTGRAFFWLVVAVAIAKLVAPRLLDLVCRTRSREAFVLTLIGLCLGMAVVTGQLGLSLALGALLAGVVIADSDYHHMAVSEVEPFRDALSSLFFVSIGMLFDPHVLVLRPTVVVAALLAVLVGKTLVIAAVSRIMGKPLWVGVRSGLLIAQVGELSFVLVQIAEPTLLPELWREVFLAAAVLSIAATPVLYAFVARARRAGAVAAEGDAAAHAGARTGHAVIVGFGPAGQAVGRAMRVLRLPFTVIEMNADTVKLHRANGVDILAGDSTRAHVLQAAGVGSARVLVLAVNDADATRSTVALARRLAPNVRIVARANYIGEVDALHRAGANEVVPQELETAVEIMARTLRHFLVADDEIVRRVQAVRDMVPSHKRAAPGQALDAIQVGEFLPGMEVQVATVEAGSELADQSLVGAQFRRRSGVNVIAVKHADEISTDVDPNRVLVAGDILVLLGAAARMADAKDLLRQAPGE
ncbi:MAG: cation:proton antiporter [Planctomycetota bacterium]